MALQAKASRFFWRSVKLFETSAKLC
jgi:hypothetical protein